jgi:hypothetical protein
MNTLEMDRDSNDFPNQETYGFCLWIGTNDILFELTRHFVNNDHLTSDEVKPLIQAMELLSNVGRKVNFDASPAGRMTIDMGSAHDCFTRVDEEFLADWLNKIFEPLSY